MSPLRDGIDAGLNAKRQGHRPHRYPLDRGRGQRSGTRGEVEPDLPYGINLERIKDKSLSELLANDKIDCAIIARPPTCFLENHPDIVRLFPDYIEMKEIYFKETGVWPIMHILAMKQSVHDEYPWVARNLYNAFLESKEQTILRILDPAISRYPLPWLAT